MRLPNGRRVLIAAVLSCCGCALGVQTSAGVTLDTHGNLGGQLRVAMHDGTRSEVIAGSGGAVSSFSFLGPQVALGYVPRLRLWTFEAVPLGLSLLFAPSGPDGVVQDFVAQARLAISSDGRFGGGPALAYSLLPVVAYHESPAPDGPDYAPKRTYHAMGATIDASLRWTSADDGAGASHTDFGASFFAGATYLFLLVGSGYCGSAFESAGCSTAPP